MELEHPGSIFDGTLTEVSGKSNTLNMERQGHSPPCWWIALQCADGVINETMQRD